MMIPKNYKSYKLCIQLLIEFPKNSQLLNSISLNIKIKILKMEKWKKWNRKFKA